MNANESRKTDFVTNMVRLTKSCLRNIFSIELMKYRSTIKRSTKANKDKDYAHWANSVSKKSLVLALLPFISLIFLLIPVAYYHESSLSRITLEYFVTSIGAQKLHVHHVDAIKLLFMSLFPVILSVQIGKTNNNRPSWIVEAKDLKDRLETLGYQKQNSPSTAILSPYGMFISLDARSAKELVDDSSFWTQIDRFPGAIIQLQKRKEIFIKNGFKLKDKYEYDISDLDM